MVIFLDTSSLIKRYIEENGSALVDGYYVQENKICISPVTVIEINSALKRKARDGSITEDIYNKAAGFWNADYPQYEIIPYSDILIEKAISVIENHQVKTLDSIQIATAFLSEADKCVTSDEKMFRVFQTVLPDKAVFI